MPLIEALGKVLAEDLNSKVFHPLQDDSAVDGYACRRVDIEAATPQTPVELRVAGQAPAGRPYIGCVTEGSCVQVFTGAAVPNGADCVIRVESTTRTGDRVLIQQVGTGPDIRRKGNGLTEGKQYLRRGDLLHPGRLALAAAMGYAELKVQSQPRVGILVTGDEIADPGEPLGPGGVYNSNKFGLWGLVQQSGATPVDLGKSPDTLVALRVKLDQAKYLDLIVTSGGVSVGEFDLVRKILEQEGTIHFWRAAIQPGGPVLLGEWKGVPILGLPGNPVSSLVTFLLFGRAIIFKLLGRIENAMPFVRAKTLAPLNGVAGKKAFSRGFLTWEIDHYVVSEVENQSSGALKSLSEGNCLIRLEPEQTVAQGELVIVLPIPGFDR